MIKTLSGILLLGAASFAATPAAAQTKDTATEDVTCVIMIVNFFGIKRTGERTQVQIELDKKMNSALSYYVGKSKNWLDNSSNKDEFLTILNSVGEMPREQQAEGTIACHERFVAEYQGGIAAMQGFTKQ